MGDRGRRTRAVRAICGGIVAALVGGGAVLAASQDVSISGLAFSPSDVTVTVGDTVTWTNSDAVVHTATADDGSWDAGNIPAGGGTGAFVFTTAGTFPYHCSIHTQMTGTVTVEAAAATTAPTAAATAVTPPTAATTVAPSDTAPLAGIDGGAGGSWLAALMIAALASVVGVAFLRRQPAQAVAATVTIQASPGRAAVPTQADITARGEATTRAGSVASIIVVAIASAVAVAVVWRRLTSAR